LHIAALYFFVQIFIKDFIIVAVVVSPVVQDC